MSIGVPRLRGAPLALAQMACAFIGSELATSELVNDPPAEIEARPVGVPGDGVPRERVLMPA